jgi:hypothetical protein
MLSEENPYGKNPPLPEEVMEAVRHLKLLSCPKTTPEYTVAQQEELKTKLGDLRPEWANCLTLQQTLDVADPAGEEFINELMDRPIYQVSIFSLNPKNCCDLKEFEIPQKPGRDMWTPAQPRRFKNPTMSALVEAWLDAQLDNERCRESKASHPAPITVVEKDGREPRVCIDYRNRNSRSEVPVFPMPNVQEFLDDNAGFEYYCSFDMKAMFNQFKIKEEQLGKNIYVSEIRRLIQNENGVISISDIQFFNNVGGQYSSSQTSQRYSDSATRQIELVADTIFAEPTQIYQIRFPNKDINVRVLNFKTINFS